MDIVDVDTLLNNSILYSKMAELICFQYLNRLSANAELRPQLEDYFLRGMRRVDFSQVAKNYVLSYQDNRCYYCDQALDVRYFHNKPRADHFIPWVFVKTSRVENLVFACNDLNFSEVRRCFELLGIVLVSCLCYYMGN